MFKGTDLKEVDSFNPRESLVVLFSFCFVGLAAYWSGLDGKRYSDDFKFLFESPQENTFNFFIQKNPNALFYRPIEAMMVCIIQSVFGMSTVPIHVLILVSHIVLAWLTYLFARSEGLERLAAVIAGVVMLASQANAFAVLSNDTFSQVGGTLFGWLAVWLFWKSFIRTSKVFLLFSVLCFAISLLMKETSLAYLVCILLVGGYLMRNESQSAKNIALRIIPFAVITVAYLALRFSIVTGLPDGRYAIQFGSNIPKNLAQFVFAAILPWSSVDTVLAFHDKQLIRISAIMLSSAAFLGVVLYGLRRSASKTKIVFISLLALGSLTPMLMIAHVSELYVYNAMPAFSVLLGIGLTETIRSIPKRAVWVGVLLLFLVSLAFNHAKAIYEKASLMHANGERAQELLQHVMPHVEHLAHDGTLVLATPPSKEPEYSIYLLNGFSVLKYGSNIFSFLSGRKDVRVWVVDNEDLGKYPPPNTALILTLDDGKVVESSANDRNREKQ